MGLLLFAVRVLLTGVMGIGPTSSAAFQYSGSYVPTQSTFPDGLEDSIHSATLESLPFFLSPLFREPMEIETATDDEFALA
jgi:hypothetical protein